MELVTVCGCLCMLVVLALVLRKQAGSTRRIPPSPPAFPIIGHLHLLRAPLHRHLEKLSLKLGHIFFLRFGCAPAIVISSPYWAQKILHEHDRDFLDRPFFEASKRVFYNCRTLVMMEYGPAWRELRKLYTLHVLTAKQVESSQKLRLEEMDRCIQYVRNQVPGIVVDVRKLVFNTVGNMMSMALFGKRSFDVPDSLRGRDCRFKELVEESARLFGTSFLGDLVPWLSWLDVQGYRKKLDQVAKGFDMFLEEVLAERMADNGGDCDDDTNADCLAKLLQLYNEDGVIDRDSIKCVLLDLMSAGIKTTTLSVEWTMAELLNNSSCMKKLQGELDFLVQNEDTTHGNPGKCIIGESKLRKVDYLQAVVKETLRLHPPFALILRQMNCALDKGVEVGGFYLPKKTRVYLNLWAMARDTSVWGSEAGIFHPDRFMTKCAPDLQGQNFEFLPFGTGRRRCPGMSMALAFVPFVVANLVLAFDWVIPEGFGLDLSEGRSFTALPTKAVVAVPVPR